MKIPLVEKLPSDLRVPRGPHEGERRFYKTALLNTLIHLHPRVCLEIGTWKGGSVKIFRRYFEKYRPDGILVTADIKEYKDVASKHVRQVKVYPHTADIFNLHKTVKKADLLPKWEKYVDDSIEANAAILLNALAGTGAELYDFAFVDGDHWNLLKDIDIIGKVVKPPRYALLDDTIPHVWPCSQVYQDKIKPRYNTYDFEDWGIFAGTSLIWEA